MNDFAESMRPSLLMALCKVLFFAFLSWGYFLTALLATAAGMALWAWLWNMPQAPLLTWQFPFYTGAVYAASPPWVYFLIAATYLLGLTIYWAPRNEAANAVEVRAFWLVLLLFAVAGGVYIQLEYNAFEQFFGVWARMAR